MDKKQEAELLLSIKQDLINKSIQYSLSSNFWKSLKSFCNDQKIAYEIMEDKR